MEDEQRLRLECLKMAVDLCGNKFDYKEIVFLADLFFKFIKGEVHV